MKVLMTGITGFIGRNLGERLINDGHEVYAIVRPTSKIDSISENLQRSVKFFTYDKNNSVMDIVTQICSDTSTRGGGRCSLPFSVLAFNCS